MQQQLNKQVGSYLPISKFLEAKNLISENTRERLESFMSQTPPQEMRYIVTGFMSDMQLCLQDMEDRKGKYESGLDKKEALLAKGYTKYGDYVQNYVEIKVPSNSAPSVKASIQRELNFEFTSDYVTSDIRYSVGGKIYTFGELLANMTEVFGQTGQNITVIHPSPSVTVGSLLEGKVPQEEVMNIPTNTISTISGQSLPDVVAAIKTGTYGHGANATMKLAQTNKDIEVKVDKATVKLPMQSIVFHQGVDAHGVTPNGTVKAEVYKTLGLDSTLKDSDRYLHARNMIQQPYDSKMCYTYFSAAWMERLITDFGSDVLAFFTPVFVPGSGECVLFRDTSKKFEAFWKNNNLLPATISILRRLLYSWCLYHPLRQKDVGPVVYIREMCNNLKWKSGLGLTTFMFHLFYRKYTMQVRVTHSDNRIRTLVDFMTAQLNDINIAPMDSIEFDPNGTVPDDGDFFGGLSNLGTSSSSAVLDTSKITNDRVIVTQEEILRQIQLKNEHDKKMREVDSQDSKYYKRDNKSADIMGMYTPVVGVRDRHETSSSSSSSEKKKIKKKLKNRNIDEERVLENKKKKKKRHAEDRGEYHDTHGKKKKKEETVSSSGSDERNYKQALDLDVNNQILIDDDQFF